MKMGQLLTLALMGLMLLTACGRAQMEESSAKIANNNIPSNPNELNWYSLDDSEQKKEKVEREAEEQDSRLKSVFRGIKVSAEEGIFDDNGANFRVSADINFDKMRGKKVPVNVQLGFCFEYGKICDVFYAIDFKLEQESPFYIKFNKEQIRDYYYDLSDHLIYMQIEGKEVQVGYYQSNVKDIAPSPVLCEKEFSSLCRIDLTVYSPEQAVDYESFFNPDKVKPLEYKGEVSIFRKSEKKLKEVSKGQTL